MSLEALPFVRHIVYNVAPSNMQRLLPKNSILKARAQDKRGGIRSSKSHKKDAKRPYQMELLQNIKTMFIAFWKKLSGRERGRDFQLLKLAIWVKARGQP